MVAFWYWLLVCLFVWRRGMIVLTVVDLTILIWFCRCGALLVGLFDLAG